MPRLFLAVVLPLFLIGQALASPIKLIIPPFTINAPEDLSYLRPALRSMLVTRLLEQGDFEIVETAGPLTQGESRARPRQPKPKTGTNAIEPPNLSEVADFIVQGTVNKIGRSFSIDVKVRDLKTRRSVGGTFVEGENLDATIGLVERLAKKVAGTILPVASVSAAESRNQSAEREWHSNGVEGVPKEGLLASMEKGHLEEREASSLSDSPRAVPSRLSFEEERYEPTWQSERLPSEVRGIGLGNLKQQGSKDLVMLTRRSLLIYEIEENGLRFQREFKGGPQDVFLRLDVSDVEKGRGYLIFLTNWSRNQVRSMVLYVTPEGIRTLGKGLGWFFRIVELPGLGTRLIGQKFDPQTTFGGPVALMVNQNGRLTEGEHLRLPSAANIYNFNFVEGKNTTGVVVQGDDGLLRFYSLAGDLTWASKESYPGTVYYLLKGKPPIFGRSLVRRDDKNGGISKLFLYHNRGLFVMPPDKKNSASGVMAFSWDGEKLFHRAETSGIDGEISDFLIGNIDSDSLDEMIVASVLRPDLGAKKPFSLLTVFKLP